MSSFEPLLPENPESPEDALTRIGDEAIWLHGRQMVVDLAAGKHVDLGDLEDHIGRLIGAAVVVAHELEQLTARHRRLVRDLVEWGEDVLGRGWGDGFNIALNEHRWPTRVDLEDFPGFVADLASQLENTMDELAWVRAAVEGENDRDSYYRALHQLADLAVGRGAVYKVMPELRWAWAVLMLLDDLDQQRQVNQADRDPWLDLPSNLNNEDDQGLKWSLLRNARDPERVRAGAVLTAGSPTAWAWVQVVAVDDDGQVHFRPIDFQRLVEVAHAAVDSEEPGAGVKPWWRRWWRRWQWWIGSGPYSD
jgi:hypothetical protein